jgi:hypothetical protein
MLALWGKEGYGWSPNVEAGKGISTAGGEAAGARVIGG